MVWRAQVPPPVSPPIMPIVPIPFIDPIFLPVQPVPEQTFSMIIPTRRLPQHVLTLLLAILLLLPAAPALAQPIISGDQLAAIVPDQRANIAEVLKAGLTAYTIEATLAPAPMNTSKIGGIVTGTAHIDYLNDTGEPITGLPLRLFANGINDTIFLDAVTVAGEPVEPEMSVWNSVATLPLPRALGAGERIVVDIDYHLEVPIGEVVHYGILGIDPENQTWALAEWYPLVAGWVDGKGWMLDSPSYTGDAIFSTTSTYDVTLHAPESMQLVTTGVQLHRSTDGGMQTARFVTGPARDFTIVADDDFISTSLEYGGTTITSWYLPGEETNGEAVAEFARRSLEYFSALIGPYPYAELDLLSVNVYGALGVEFPQLVYMGRDYYTRDIDLDAPSNLEFTVAHEVLHQWFYGMIGNNQYDHAFIDEGLTQYISGDLYFRHVYGDTAGATFSENAFRNTYASGIANRGDRTIVDTPSDSFNSSTDYVFAMYYKAPMGFDTILKAIGVDAFTAALQDYFNDFRFGIAQPEDLLRAFETASGQDLGDLWYLWFESASG